MNCLHWMSELFICLLGSYFVQHAVKRNFFLEPECWCCGPNVLWPRRCAAGLASLRDEPISDHSPSLLLPVTVRNTIICALTHTKTDSKWKRFVLLVGHRKKSGLDYRPMQWKVPSVMDSYIKASWLKNPQQWGKLVLKVIIIGQLVPSTKNVIHHRK